MSRSLRRRRSPVQLSFLISPFPFSPLIPLLGLSLRPLRSFSFSSSLSFASLRQCRGASFSYLLSLFSFLFSLFSFFCHLYLSFLLPFSPQISSKINFSKNFPLKYFVRMISCCTFALANETKAVSATIFERFS